MFATPGILHTVPTAMDHSDACLDPLMGALQRSLFACQNRASPCDFFHRLVAEQGSAHAQLREHLRLELASGVIAAADLRSEVLALANLADAADAAPTAQSLADEPASKAGQSLRSAGLRMLAALERQRQGEHAHQALLAPESPLMQGLIALTASGIHRQVGLGCCAASCAALSRSAMQRRQGAGQHVRATVCFGRAAIQRAVLGGGLQLQVIHTPASGQDPLEILHEIVDQLRAHGVALRWRARLDEPLVVMTTGRALRREAP